MNWFDFMRPYARIPGKEGFFAVLAGSVLRTSIAVSCLPYRHYRAMGVPISIPDPGAHA
jgi:hypothetical protein